LIGYLGTEVATNDPFHRLLWPRRAFSNFLLRNAWKVGIFMPLGGPLHKTALDTMDTFFKHGLFQGGLCGHILDTAFFPDTDMTYQLFEDGLFKREANVRNGLWVRVLNRIPLRVMETMPKLKDPESKREFCYSGARALRQTIPVNYLQLSVEEERKARGVAKSMIVESDVGPVTLQILLAIITTEVTGIGVAIAVAIIWKSAFMIMWLVPLMLKLLSAFLTLSREEFVLSKPTVSMHTATASEGNEGVGSRHIICPTRKFLIISKQGFQVIDGPEEVVLQFFRHHGHPQRCRWKELVQIAIVAAFGLNFPVGLVCSLIWMPVSLQCVWTVYVLYVTGVMYISRYIHGDWWATIEERLSDKFIRTEETPGQPDVLFKTADGTCLLAKLTRTTHNSHTSAKAHAMTLLSASSSPTSNTSEIPRE
jgi:hypothetical protein